MALRLISLQVMFWIIEQDSSVPKATEMPSQTLRPAKRHGHSLVFSVQAYGAIRSDVLAILKV